MNLDNRTLAIIGLGYVGLPLAVEFGKRRATIGFDINPKRISELQTGREPTLECSWAELKEAAQLRYSCQPEDLKEAPVFIVTVPTAVDQANRPDVTPLVKASETVGKVLKTGDVVIYESTIYPGATEEVCVPVLEKVSGLKFNVDFFCGYSPERINPGDKEHRLPSIKKVTSGSTREVADAVNALYAQIITAGTHKASSIKVAEAAKVIENTQRDVNIALINELSLIFHKLGIDTLEVLQAAGTKWNFLPSGRGWWAGTTRGSAWTRPNTSTGRNACAKCRGRRVRRHRAGCGTQTVCRARHRRAFGQLGAVLFDVKGMLPLGAANGRL